VSHVKALIALAAAAAALALPAGAEASTHGCGNTTMHVPDLQDVGWSDFKVTNMSCASAVKVMRVIARHPRWRSALGFKITTRQYVFTGRHGNERFTCALFGTD
jgi:hypothetical protein